MCFLFVFGGAGGGLVIFFQFVHGCDGVAVFWYVLWFVRIYKYECFICLLWGEWFPLLVDSELIVSM